MLVLAIDSSTPRSSVCLANEDGVVASASIGSSRRHGEFITPGVRFCLDQAGLDVDAISGVAVGIGPGLFTGLRVGIMTAKAFAAARRLPMVGLSGLDVLAFQVRYVRRLICAAIDARRGELFWAFYRPVPGGVQRVSELRIGTPDTLAGQIEGAGQDCLVVGDGAVRHREPLVDAGAQCAGTGFAWPRASDLSELAIPRFVREETARHDEIAPLYLRVADAKIGWETRGRLRGGQ